jgi:hypothetical protein
LIGLSYPCLQFAVVGNAARVGAAYFETPALEGLTKAADAILYVGLLASAATFTILVIALRHTTRAEAMILLST